MPKAIFDRREVLKTAAEVKCSRRLFSFFYWNTKQTYF
jgi:hypothetical protein